MEATYKAFGGRLLIKFTASTVKELFEQIGSVAEVLDADQVCGKCGSQNIYPNVRTAQGQYDYYELVCSETDCGARLSFGQNKDQAGLFAKRERDGVPMQHRGWHIYRVLPAATTAPMSGSPPPASSSPGSNPRSAMPASPRDGSGSPPGSTSGYSRLEIFLRRSAEPEPGRATEVFSSLYELLRMCGSEADADRIWQEAIVKNGDPALKPTAVPGVIKYMYQKLMAFEEASLAKKTG